jgi:hypothetical protein
MKTNIFQYGSAGFKATIGLEKKGHKGDVFGYVENVDVISLRRTHNYREHEGKTIKTDGRQLLLDALKRFGISGRDRIPNYQGIF